MDVYITSLHLRQNITDLYLQIRKGVFVIHQKARTCPWYNNVFIFDQCFLYVDIKSQFSSLLMPCQLSFIQHATMTPLDNCLALCSKTKCISNAAHLEIKILKIIERHCGILSSPPKKSSKPKTLLGESSARLYKHGAAPISCAPLWRSERDRAGGQEEC